MSGTVELAEAAVVLEGSTRPRPDAEVHDTFCELARSLAAGSRVVFRYIAAERVDSSEKPFVLCIDPGDLANYLGVRGFALVSDVVEGEPYRIAMAQRRTDRGSCCGLAPTREASR
jgi:O-methyltransferase involved in polyketide biosynthesis